MSFLSLVHSFQAFLSSALAALQTVLMLYSHGTLANSHALNSWLPVLKSLCPTSWSSEPALSHRQAAFLIVQSRQAKQADSPAGFCRSFISEKTSIPSVPVGKTR